MAKKSVVKALTEAIAEEMARDQQVILIGEDVGKYGGACGTYIGLQEKYGVDRVVEMPVAELGFSVFSCGAAVAGFRPVVDIMFADFSSLAFEAIVNVAPKVRYTSNGKLTCPATFILAQGGGMGNGCQHAQCVESWYTNTPGLKVVAPTFPSDLIAFMKASIRDDDPVVFLYPKGILGYTEEVPDRIEAASLFKAAKVVKDGSDVTVVAYHRALLWSLEAATELEKDGVQVEVIDPRVLVPFDRETVFKSVRKTGRLVVVQEAPLMGGFGMQISALVAENCLKDLKAPIKRVGMPNIVIPTGKKGEEYTYPTPAEIAEAVKTTLNSTST